MSLRKRWLDQLNEQREPSPEDEEEAAYYADMEQAEFDRRESVYEPREEICPDCRGTGLNLIDPGDGGSCPSCIRGRRIF